jgi:hypothetical protein
VPDPKARYSPRDLRAIDAVALGLIGAGVFVGVGTAGGRIASTNPVAAYFACAAMLLCGAALAIAVRRQQRDQEHPGGDGAAGGPPAA